MTICINGRFLSQPTTGVQRYAEQLSLALMRLAPDSFVVLAPRDARGFAGVVKVGRLTGHLWEQFELPRAVGPRLLLSLGNTGPLALRRQLVVMHDAAVFAYPSDVAQAFGIWYRFLLPRLARRVARLITVSGFSATELAKYCRVDRDRFGVHQPGIEHVQAAAVDLSILESLDLAPASFVLAVGSDPRKNVDTVRAAMRLIDDLSLRLIVIRREQRAFAAERDRSARDEIEVSDPQLRALYEHALCLAYPSRYEGFGLPPLEAMIAGCPVIVSGSASLPEVCGNAALYCDAEDPASLAKHIRSLADNSALRTAYIGRGLARAAHFSWARCAEGILGELVALEPSLDVTSAHTTAAGLGL